MPRLIFHHHHFSLSLGSSELCASTAGRWWLWLQLRHIISNSCCSHGGRSSIGENAIRSRTKNVSSTFAISVAVRSDDVSQHSTRVNANEQGKFHFVVFRMAWLAKWRNPISPHPFSLSLCSITEENFWRNYFYRVALIIQAGELGTLGTDDAFGKREDDDGKIYSSQMF